MICDIRRGSGDSYISTQWYIKSCCMATSPFKLGWVSSEADRRPSKEAIRGWEVILEVHCWASTCCSHYWGLGQWGRSSETVDNREHRWGLLVTSISSSRKLLPDYSPSLQSAYTGRSISTTTIRKRVVFTGSHGCIVNRGGAENTSVRHVQHQL